MLGALLAQNLERTLKLHTPEVFCSWSGTKLIYWPCSKRLSLSTSTKIQEFRVPTKGIAIPRDLEIPVQIDPAKYGTTLIYAALTYHSGTRFSSAACILFHQGSSAIFRVYRPTILTCLEMDYIVAYR